MKLLIIRHGDPNYAIDSLTEAGWKEAQLLSHRLCKLDIKAFYCSPMGRAKDTASLTLQKLGREAEILPWLREFPPQIEKEGREGLSVIWDWLPAIWKDEPAFFDHQRWMEPEIFQQAGVVQVYQDVTEGLDALLARHGYVRDGYHYRAEAANEDTIVLFCHFGLECVLLGHLLHISHGAVARHLRRPQLRHHPGDRRAPGGHRQLPDDRVRRHFPPVRRRPSPCLCRPIL